MNLNDLHMSLKSALDNMWARIDARIHAIEQGGGGGGGGGVTGVKGNAESSYRQGNVNLTPANIGAVNKAGDTMTGPLTTNSDAAGIFLYGVSAGNPGMFFKNPDADIAAIYVLQSDHHMLFRSFVPNSNAYEDYGLPAPTGAGDYQILTTKNPAQARVSMGICAGNYVSVFNNGKTTVSVSQWQLSNKPSVLILTLMADASETSDPTQYRHDAFLSYDIDNSTSENIVICGYRANGTPLNGYMSYSYLAIP